jgi:tRNA dimethylallyltransferase
MNEPENHPLLVILGPTASGKTTLAAKLAFLCRGEIISADSRQVYRDMNLGTGKDYGDYSINDRQIPYHLIDIAEAGEKYNIFEYQKDFRKVYQDIIYRQNLPVLCGGSGLYIDAVIHEYRLVQVPINESLRESLAHKSMEELGCILTGIKRLHNTSDITERKRLIRAIEIAVYEKENGRFVEKGPQMQTLIFGLNPEVQIRRTRITERLKARLKAGMVDEVEFLLKKGISPEQLIYYGLEYKFITQYLAGELKYDEMFSLLNIAIHQFAKRQMTWFRKMEKEGTQINWLDPSRTAEQNIEAIISVLRQQAIFASYIPHA